MHIFSQTGSVESVPISGGTDSPKAFFSLTKNMSTGNSFGSGNDSSSGSVLFGNLPVTGLTVDQAVDHSISKTLNKDFVISEFGDTPVQITMNGVNFYGGCLSSGDKNKQIMDFYENNKLSKDPKARFKLSITPNSTDNGTFTCVLTKMRAVGPLLEKQGTVPAYSYNITLIGVKT